MSIALISIQIFLQAISMNEEDNHLEKNLHKVHGLWKTLPSVKPPKNQKIDKTLKMEFSIGKLSYREILGNCMSPFMLAYGCPFNDT